MALISIIIPCYFNEENIPVTFARLHAMESSLPDGTEVEYLFIAAWSGDGQLSVLHNLPSNEPDRIVVIKLAGNVG